MVLTTTDGRWARPWMTAGAKAARDLLDRRRMVGSEVRNDDATYSKKRRSGWLGELIDFGN